MYTCFSELGKTSQADKLSSSLLLFFAFDCYLNLIPLDQRHRHTRLKTPRDLLFLLGLLFYHCPQNIVKISRNINQFRFHHFSLSNFPTHLPRWRNMTNTRHVLPPNDRPSKPSSSPAILTAHMASGSRFYQKTPLPLPTM